MHNIRIYSEILPLRKVLVHAPGPEIERMTQDELGGLLFDDILSVEQAAREHRLLRDILGAGGAEILELSDLLLEGIEAAPPEAVADLLDSVCELDAAHEIAPLLAAQPPDVVARALLEGLYWDDLSESSLTLARLRAKVHETFSMPLRPLPNAMFARDPCISLFDRILVGRMATAARRREPYLVDFALRHTGHMGPNPPLMAVDDLHRHPAYRSMEGGDILVIDPRFILIGCSERTTPETIERVSKEALFPSFPQLESVYAVIMPQRRSVMHLDTILTQVDEGLFLGHEPLIVGRPGTPALPVVRLTRGAAPKLTGGSVLDILREELGPHVRVVPCGGDSPLHQEREQWTDGANAVCVSPGHIVLYGRNRYTIRSLCEQHGFAEVPLSLVHSDEERAERLSHGMQLRRAVFSFTGGELSRARGGGRCLTMPLSRA